MKCQCLFPGTSKKNTIELLPAEFVKSVVEVLSCFCGIRNSRIHFCSIAGVLLHIKNIQVYLQLNFRTQYLNWQKRCDKAAIKNKKKTKKNTHFYIRKGP